MKRTVKDNIMLSYNTKKVFGLVHLMKVHFPQNRPVIFFEMFRKPPKRKQEFKEQSCMRSLTHNTNPHNQCVLYYQWPKWLTVKIWQKLMIPLMDGWMDGWMRTELIRRGTQHQDHPALLEPLVLQRMRVSVSSAGGLCCSVPGADKRVWHTWQYSHYTSKCRKTEADCHLVSW